MSRIYTLYEQNFAHFTFLSQHFHKSLTLITGKPLLKGVKAHDRFSRLFGWQSLNEVNQYLRGHDKRLHDFGILPRDRIISEYADLYGDIPIKKLMRVYYDLFAFSHAEFRSDSLCIETLRQLKSFSFFPKDPDKNLVQVADYLAVALENFSFRMKLERGPINRDLLNSVLMLYFDFYQKELISDFDWQDIADLTHPNCYHDAFIKYKTQLKPTFKFISSASHCYDKIAYYTGHEHQLAAHENLCQFISIIQKKDVIAREDRELIRFSKVYQNAIVSKLSTVSLSNSFEDNKDRRFTLDDFDFSKVRIVTSDELNDNDMAE